MEILFKIVFAFLAAGICTLPFIIPALWLYREIKKIEAKQAEKEWRAGGQIIDIEARTVTDEDRRPARHLPYSG